MTHSPAGPPSSSTASAPDREGERALAMLAPKLAKIAQEAVLRPSTDPHGAAATALLVGDYLAQPDLRSKLGAVKMTTGSVQELRGVARAIMTLVTRLGGDYLPDTPSIPGDLVQRGQGVRTTIAAALEKALPDDPELQVWLEAIRLGSGVVDLVYDLRTLAGLCTQYSGTSGAAGTATAGMPPLALSAADALEFALRTGDPPETAQARDAIARLWTLFVPAYDRAVAAAQTLTRGEGRERQFPALALVASHRRARRRPLSVMPSHAPRRSAPPRRSGVPGTGPGSMGALRISSKMPASPAVPDFDDVELIEADDVEPVELKRPPPPPVPSARATAAPPIAPVAAPPIAPPAVPIAPVAAPPIAPPAVPLAVPTSEDRADWSDTRRAARHTIEIEVGIASESNFYLGFTENLSSGGVFVATYVIKPLGSPVEVALAFPNGEELKVAGIVRWLREATPDAWPGMGVQFESLSPQDEAKIRKFLSLREPMFYDE